MTKILRLILIVLLVGVMLLHASAAPRASHVFIISIDGGKPAVIAKSEMPVLQQLAAEGARAWQATTIYPSITLPAHTSMLTGVGPKKHRVLWNDYLPKKGTVKVPTVFSEAKRAGFSTAIFVGKEKFRALDVPGTVDEFSFDAAASGIVKKHMVGDIFSHVEKTVRANVVAADAALYIVRNQPSVCFIHFTDPDDFGHEFGWGSPQQMKSLADVDSALEVIMLAIRDAGIADDSVVIITADHGGHNKTHGSKKPDDMIIPWIVWGKGVKKNFDITAPVNTCDTAATALWLLGIAPSTQLDGQPVTSAFE